MLKILISVFVGGGTGSLLRYVSQLIITRYLPFGMIPLATFSVNVVGSFLIGLFYAISARFNLSDDVRLLLTTGLCGGFTTFSTFSYEGMAMIRQGSYGTFALYAAASVSICIAAAFAGNYAAAFFPNAK